MRKLGIWEKLCHIAANLSPHHGANNNASSTSILRAGSKRKGSLVLIGFGFVLGASVLILTVIFSMFPSVMNPMLQNNLAKVDRQIPLSFDSSFSSNPLQENTFVANQTISSFFSNASQENLSSFVSGSVLKVEELVVANDETNAITTTSNISSNRTGMYNEKQENVYDDSSQFRHDCNIFEGEWSDEQIPISKVML
ncbi:hypothetical protein MKW98_012668 [Papaver atlanticum]|uniref:Uncharacterized protein n=1 Tax=Papaver atlanticum TaxID=357466 RepID=A0AAD4T2I0_9MAGN|nr:hypothetical protein MKW98_012668 [Papaver atlanticum]